MENSDNIEKQESEKKYYIENYKLMLSKEKDAYDSAMRYLQFFITIFLAILGAFLALIRELNIIDNQNEIGIMFGSNFLLLIMPQLILFFCILYLRPIIQQINIKKYIKEEIEPKLNEINFYNYNKSDEKSFVFISYKIILYIISIISYSGTILFSFRMEFIIDIMLSDILKIDVLIKYIFFISIILQFIYIIIGTIFIYLIINGFNEIKKSYEFSPSV